ncbi:hypothetical protein RIF29_30003 [Crotalaria pallida]|uniref:MSP domain-containing protein n=1 Tax=Crotalaria pallida TaxID=3830 RepID=A0AAN9EHP0_CROPI
MSGTERRKRRNSRQPRAHDERTPVPETKELQRKNEAATEAEDSGNRSRGRDFDVEKEKESEREGLKETADAACYALFSSLLLRVRMKDRREDTHCQRCTVSLFLEFQNLSPPRLSLPVTDIATALFSDPSAMISGELLSIQPQELQFPFELRKQISCSLQLSNNTDNYVAFKVKTTNPKKYCVRPNTGVVLPRSTCDVIVTMQAQKEAPPDLQCKDKFLLQSVVASPGTTTKDITPEMFNREAGHNVEECKLRVVYVAPPRPPSPVREGSDEESSPRVSVSETGHSDASEFIAAASRAFNERVEPHDTTPETRALLSKATEERNSAIDQKKRLQNELELLRREVSRNRGGMPTMYVIVVALIGFILGYFLKRT